MINSQIIKQQCAKLKLPAIADSLDDMVTKANKNQVTYTDFVKSLFELELSGRMEKDMQRRMKLAALPLEHDLDMYDYDFKNGIIKRQLAQLRELSWLEQNYNIILMGPSGVSKSFIAAGLCFDAIKKGYKAYFKSMEELIRIINTKCMTRNAKAEYNRILSAHLIIIDDIMMVPIRKEEAVAFFNLINDLHQKASIVITTNKSPKQWVEVLNDEVVTTALLDRILFRCEVIKLSGKSYRLQNRKTIFENSEKNI